ncbi:hypothetical protein F4809DRAFT_599359, partial [Biscogniauxia mediterranea]
FFFFFFLAILPTSLCLAMLTYVPPASFSSLSTTDRRLAHIYLFISLPHSVYPKGEQSRESWNTHRCLLRRIDSAVIKTSHHEVSWRVVFSEEDISLGKFEISIFTGNQKKNSHVSPPCVPNRSIENQNPVLFIASS